MCVVLWYRVNWEVQQLQFSEALYNSDPWSKEDGFSIGSLHLLKTKGQGWTIFNSTSTSPLFDNRGYQCDWTSYKRAASDNDNDDDKRTTTRHADICLHAGQDVVSDSIKVRHTWPDCLAVSMQYDRALQVVSKGIDGQQKQRSPFFHLEIGANIGACVVDLLLSNDDVHIIAFEPYPKNAFALTSTLLRNSALHRRVTVFPVALGRRFEEELQMALEQPTNYGSARVYPNTTTTTTTTMLRQQQQDKTSTVSDEIVTIPTERLDNLIAVESPTTIVSAKLDTQGSECHILDGMKGLLSNISRLSIELEQETLKQFDDCSRELLLDRLRRANMDIFRYRGYKRLVPLPEREMDMMVVAVRSSVDETVAMRSDKTKTVGS